MRADLAEAVEDLEPDAIKEVVDRLQYKGIVTDEEGLCLASPAMEHCYSLFDKIFRKHGYTGGSIACAGLFVSTGAIYALYDSDRFDPVTSREYLAYFSKKKQ